MVRFWDPVNWKLSEIHEIFVRKNGTSQDLILNILELKTDIKKEDIDVTRVLALTNFT